MAIRIRTTSNRSTPDVLRAIAADTGTLVRKELELARQELTEAMTVKAKGAAALAAGGVIALIGIAFLGVTIGQALYLVVVPWLAWLLTGVAFLLLGGVVALVGRRVVMSRSVVPGETVRTVQEDVTWARTQLRR